MKLKITVQQPQSRFAENNDAGLDSILIGRCAPQYPVETRTSPTARKVRRMSESTLNRLHGQLRPAIDDAKAVKILLDARAQLILRQAAGGSSDDLLNAFGENDFLKKIQFDTRSLTAAFSDNQHAFLLRTLIRKDPPSSTEKQVADSVTSGKTERNTLNNQLPERDILLTPATIIYPGIKIATISDHPDRPRWHGMPSIIYATPANQHTSKIGKIDNYRKMFGNALSFASNNGFTDNFVKTVKSGLLSHAELLDTFKKQSSIIENLKTPEPFNELHESLPELLQQIQGCRTHPDIELNADGSIKHNEVITRLWLWDATAVEVGKDIGEGLCAAIELQVARSSLEKGLQTHGSRHPLFHDFLMQQLSVGDGNVALKKAATEKKFNRLTNVDQQQILDGLVAKLQEPVTLCHYTAATGAMTPVALTTLQKKDVVAAMDTVLAARLGPTAPALKSDSTQTDPPPAP